MSHQMSKDEWIQSVKAFLFDFIVLEFKHPLTKEAIELLEKGGGYDFTTETPTSTLHWPTDNHK